jgi:hypothetical protein
VLTALTQHDALSHHFAHECFFDMSFAFVNGLGSTVEADILIASLLQRFDINVLYLGQVDDNVTINCPTICAIPASLDRWR